MKQKQTFKPVKAWASIDKYGDFYISGRDNLAIFVYRRHADETSPFGTVVPVLISPILPSKPRRTPKKPNKK